MNVKNDNNFIKDDCLSGSIFISFMPQILKDSKMY